MSIFTPNIEINPYDYRSTFVVNINVKKSFFWDYNIELDVHSTLVD